MRAFSFILLSGALLGTACNNIRKDDLSGARYWQRSSASSALYLRGPKAQQMLHENISSCVAEIKELERLGEIRKAVPSSATTRYTNGNKEYLAYRQLNEWETPIRDGYLYGEYLEYHDFETCMTDKGWERAEYIPYDEAERARINYERQYLERKGQRSKVNDGPRENVTTLSPYAQDRPPYEDLNE